MQPDLKQQKGRSVFVNRKKPNYRAGFISRQAVYKNVHVGGMNNWEFVINKGGGSHMKASPMIIFA